MNVHKNARLAPCGREVLVSRLERGEHPRDVGTAMGVSTSTVYKWWRRYRFHDLRHFRASCLIADGANPKEVMVEMGHASIQMTVDTYGHLFPEDAAPRRARAEGIAAGVLAPPA